jgi:hypothetical protein
MVLFQGRLRLYLIMTSRAAVLGHRKYPVVRSSSRSPRFFASCQSIVDRLPIAKCKAAIRCVEAKLDTQSMDDVVSIRSMPYRLIFRMTCFTVQPGDRSGWNVCQSQSQTCGSGLNGGSCRLVPILPTTGNVLPNIAIVQDRWRR